MIVCDAAEWLTLCNNHFRCAHCTPYRVIPQLIFFDEMWMSHGAQHSSHSKLFSISFFCHKFNRIHKKKFKSPKICNTWNEQHRQIWPNTLRVYLICLRRLHGERARQQQNTRIDSFFVLYFFSFTFSPLTQTELIIIIQIFIAQFNLLLNHNAHWHIRAAHELVVFFSSFAWTKCNSTAVKYVDRETERRRRKRRKKIELTLQHE